jgi:hypothetical protein
MNYNTPGFLNIYVAECQVKKQQCYSFGYGQHEYSAGFPGIGNRVCHSWSKQDFNLFVARHHLQFEVKLKMMASLQNLTIYPSP